LIYSLLLTALLHTHTHTHAHAHAHAHAHTHAHTQLMELIFDKDMMKAQMVEIGYDANKLPLVHLELVLLRSQTNQSGK
jgi:hypothetical protein